MPRKPSQNWALNAYIAAICASAAALLYWLATPLLDHELHVAVVPVTALALVLVLGELRPIRISHGDGSVDEVTISSSFSLALVLLGPLFVAVVAQAVATLLDDVRQRKDWRRIAFNLSQYTITLTVSRAAYAFLSGRSMLQDPARLHASDIAAGIAAAAVFFVSNHVITTCAVALSLGEDPVRRLPVDLRYHLSTSGVLLALAPVLVVAVDFSVVALPLLLMPIAAVHKSAKLAIQREAASLHDSLTGLPNRILFHQRGATLVGPKAPTPAALMLIDLDYFKEINDTLGHHVGDRVIEETAVRLTTAFGSETTVARLGGDEFAVLTPTANIRDVVALARGVLAAMSAPFLVDDMRIDMGASIGIARSPEHATDVDTLLRHADVALYAAKEERNTFRVYSAADDQNTLRRLALLGDLREAIATDQLQIHYQPKADARTGCIIGVEALARWIHPELGLVMPDEFIALAEHSGLMGPLAQRVLDSALPQLLAWRTLSPSLTLAVNVSPRQLSDRDLPRLVASALTKAKVPAAALTLEVTETSAMGTSARVVGVLQELHSLGVALAIDDFGSGSTSLSYLGRLALSELKIDKQFVVGLADHTNHAIVRSTIELGHNLGLKVVAEGVESVEVWRELVLLDCDVVQGFLVAGPVLASEITRLLLSAASPQLATSSAAPIPEVA